MKNLIDIKRLKKEEITAIINRAAEFKAASQDPARGEINYTSGISDFARLGERLYRANSCSNKTACLMFFENSTRTKCSFAIAAQKLGMNIIDFNVQTSSLSKGETLKDTLDNLYYMGVNTVILRHSEDDMTERMSKEVKFPMAFINAGDGKSAHPTQALLDYMTMLEKLGTVEGKKIVIAGDVSHSRVAKSNLALLSKMGANVHFFAPEYFTPKNKEEFNVIWEDDYNTAITDADVVMLLRIQTERLSGAETEKAKHYSEKYCLTTERLEKYAPNAILMHPGPVNRDIEVSSELLDSQKGKTILEQARNGVYVRMAVLENAAG